MYRTAGCHSVHLDICTPFIGDGRAGACARFGNGLGGIDVRVSASDEQASVCGRFDSGGINSSALSCDNAGMLQKVNKPKFYQKPMVQNAGSLALMIGVPVAEALGIYAAVHYFKHKHHHDKDKDP